MSDWRDAMLAGLRPLPAAATGDAVRTGTALLGGRLVVVAAWDFSVRGGSFGVADATAFVDAVTHAAGNGLPLLSLVRTGGTRLQEGMRALVGIPRALLALDELAAAGQPHVAVADHPTTGGVWVVVASKADVRIGVEGATVGFSGPRAIEAMTGVTVAGGTAEAALDAGLVDRVVPAADVARVVEETVATLRPDDPAAMDAPPPHVAVPDRGGWEQVEHSRTAPRPSGADLVAALLDEAIPLRGNDSTVVAAIGRIAGRRVVIVAGGSERAGQITPAGYRLVVRAAGLAGRLRVPLVTLVDTAGADPLPGSERDGIAPAIGAAMAAVLDCASPTVAIVHGEGGSGGALALAVCDVVAVTDTGWFAALAPEGAAATLRTTPHEAADLMRVAPADLLAGGFADAMTPSDVDGLRAWLATTCDSAVRRRDRWRHESSVET